MNKVCRNRNAGHSIQDFGCRRSDLRSQEVRKSNSSSSLSLLNRWIEIGRAMSPGSATVLNLCTRCANPDPRAQKAPTTIFRVPFKPRRSCVNRNYLRPKLHPDSSHGVSRPEFHRCTILMELTHLPSARKVAPPESRISPSGDPVRSKSET